MHTIKQPLKNSAFAVTSFCLLLPSLALSNPELVADLTPGGQSTDISNLRVEDDLLKLTIIRPGPVFVPPEFQIAFDSEGSKSRLPIEQDDYYTSIEFNGRLFFADDDVVWEWLPQDLGGYDVDEIYRLREDEEYWDGYVRSSVESFFIQDNALYLVEQKTDGYADDRTTYKLLKINTDAGDATLVADPYYPFGSPAEHPDTNNAVRSYRFNDATYYVIETAEAGQELWSIQGDGGDRELALVADIKPGATGSYPNDFTTFRNAMYFTANGPDGRELWKLDASGQLQQLADINPKGAAFTYMQYPRLGYVEFQGELYFIAYHADYGNEIWKTDGTESGTVMVSDAIPGKAGIATDVYLYALVQDANGFYFTAQGEGEAKPSIWLTNGTEAGTQRVFSDAFFRVDDAFLVGDATYIKTADKNFEGPFSLWQVANGTTIEAVQLLKGYRYLDVWNAVFRNRSFFISVEDETVGRELWISNGTSSGTRLIKDIYPGAMGSDPRYLATFKRRVLFSADDGVSGNELWLTDGSADGTVLLDDINPGADASQPQFYGQTQKQVFLRAFSPDSGNELWATDGTADGTRLVKDIYPGPEDGALISGGYHNERYYPRSAVFSGLLYFVGVNDVDGEELWVSDGSEAGTQMVGPIHPDTTEFNPDVEHPLDPASMVEFNGDIYFVQYNTGVGTELWKYRPYTNLDKDKGALGNFVWVDENGDGRQDPGESGLGNVSVRLQTCDGFPLASVRTNSGGFFQFDNLDADYYQLRFSLPSGYRFSPEKAAHDYTLDSNAHFVWGLTDCIDLTQGWHRMGIDAGMVPVD